MWFLTTTQILNKALLTNSLMLGGTVNKNLQNKLAFKNENLLDTFLSNTILKPSFLTQKFFEQLLLKKAHFWSMEMLLRFGVNNNFVIFQTPTVPGIVTYRHHFLQEQFYKKFNKKTHSEMIFGFTTGRCGFVRNQKRTFLATDITIRTALWFCKRIFKFLNSVKIRFLGESRNIKRYLKNFTRFGLGHRQVLIHSLIDVTPTPYNGVRRKLRGRKRYRYHQYTYKRFKKMYRSNLSTRKTFGTVNYN